MVECWIIIPEGVCGQSDLQSYSSLSNLCTCGIPIPPAQNGSRPNTRLVVSQYNKKQNIFYIYMKIKNSGYLDWSDFCEDKYYL